MAAGEHLDQGRLAGTVGPQQRHHFPGKQVEVDALEHGAGAERLAQCPGADQGTGQGIRAGGYRSGHGDLGRQRKECVRDGAFSGTAWLIAYSLNNH